MTLTFKKPLPGTRAQLEMAPPHRVDHLLSEMPQGAVDSAVLILLTPVNEGKNREELLEWNVLLIRRNSYNGIHSGQIALPGGKCEAGDNGFCDTACREAFEEVGVSMSQMEIVGALTSIYVPPSNFVMHPFVAVKTSPGALRPDPREVADYKQVPVKTFDPATSVSLEFDDQAGNTRIAPAWRYEDYTIWGATSMILAELFRAIDEEVLTM